MTKKFLLLGGAALLCSMASAPAFANDDLVIDDGSDYTPVDVELQLLIDTSGSISRQEYELQMRGYYNAFRDSSIQSSILDTSDGSYGSIAVQTVMWSSRNRQEAMTDWTLLDSVDSINNYADTLYNIDRPFTGQTYNAEALTFGSSLFDNNFAGTRSVIDMSGDGYGYDYMFGPGGPYSSWGGGYYTGNDTADARDFALDNYVDTINGLTITYDYQGLGDQDLTTWFAGNVIGGTDAFVLQAGDFADFTVALAQKLEAEIDGGYIPPNAITPGETYSAPAPLAGSGFLSVILLCLYRLMRNREQDQGLHFA